jgi:hypothetical protein
VSVGAIAAATAGAVPVVELNTLPANVRRPYQWLDLLRTMRARVEAPLAEGTKSPWNAGQAVRLLDAIAGEFPADAVRNLRVEISARLFLDGLPKEASELLKNESPNDHAREVLADLRAIVLGEGQLRNPQVSRFIPNSGLQGMPGALALVPDSLRDQWKRPRPPAETETTLGKLEAGVKKELVETAEQERSRLVKKVAAAREAIGKEIGR